MGLWIERRVNEFEKGYTEEQKRRGWTLFFHLFFLLKFSWGKSDESVVKEWGKSGGKMV